MRGLTGLRIADASVLPVQVSGNTAAPAMLVGYRAADLALADLLRGAFLLPPRDEPPPMWPDRPRVGGQHGLGWR